STGETVAGRVVLWFSMTGLTTSSPFQLHERYCLPRQIGGDGHFALAHIKPFRRVDEFELSGLLQLRILLGRRGLRRAHRLPHCVGIAVRLVDAEVLEKNSNSSTRRNGLM